MNFKPAVLSIIIVGAVAAVPFVNGIVFSTDGKRVDVAPIAQRVISPSILASGFLAHEEEVLLSPEVIGKVTALYVEEGDRVAEGQRVLQVDDTNLLAGLEQSEAAVRINSIEIERQEVRIDNLRRQYERTRSLHERNMVGDEEYERVSNDLDLAGIDLKSSRERLLQAEAQLEQVRDELRKTQIVSPLNGVVTSLDIKVGETAIASSTNIRGSALMTIANPESIYVEVLVDEADIANIEIGQRSEVVAIAYPDQPMVGTVRYIANTAKVEEGRQGLTFTVKIDITDSAGVALRPGMSCRAEIFTKQDQEVAAVPIQAILFEENRSEQSNQHFIFLNDNGVARKTPVDVGLSDDEYQELTTSIEGEVEIVVGPDRELRNLLDGDTLDVSRLD